MSLSRAAVAFAQLAAGLHLDSKAWWRWDGEPVSGPEELASAGNIPLLEAKVRYGETKSVRRVRSLAGVEQYGQPIGSVIVPDAPDTAAQIRKRYPHRVLRQLERVGVTPDPSGMVRLFAYLNASGTPQSQEIGQAQRLYAHEVPELEHVVEEGILKRVELSIPAERLSPTTTDQVPGFVGSNLGPYTRYLVGRDDVSANIVKGRQILKGDPKAKVHDDGTVTLYLATEVKPRRIAKTGLDISYSDFPYFFTQRVPGQKLVELRVPLESVRVLNQSVDRGGVQTVELTLDAQASYNFDVAAHMTEVVPEDSGHVPIHTWEEMRRYGAMKDWPAGTTTAGAGKGMSAETVIVHLPNGRKLVTKEYAVRETDRPEKERLASLVGEAVGARVPKVTINEGGTPPFVVMDHIEAEMANDVYGSYSQVPPEVRDSDQAILMGFLDALIGNDDRHTQNWLVDENGDLWGIDHGEAFVAQDPTGKPWSPDWVGFVGHFVYDPKTSLIRWKSENPLHPEDVAEVRRRLETIKDEFKFAPRNGWDPMKAFEVMMARLDQIERNATGTRRLVS